MRSPTREAVRYRARSTLIPLRLAAGDVVNASLRAENGLQAAIIEAQARALDPPFTLRFFRSSKVALPAFVGGVLLGVATTG